ncbi:MAG TPA: carboxylating nicotinate-nucleotide diphosphorylase [Bacteroidota bacterium]|nr:carboxylating nicotinate-nucleotide diphosphorylase [Bacteroidota bacterium]
MTPGPAEHFSFDGGGDDRITRIIEEALAEDVGMGDMTTDAVIPSDAPGSAEILVKEEGVICGLEIAARVFALVDEQLAMHAHGRDGDRVSPGTRIAFVKGPTAGLLKGERTALNFLQRMSGIATLTRRFVDAVGGTRARITDTRKTPPGLRLIDKMAVAAGGGVNHRFGLDDMILIKDNHITAAGGITPAVRRCQEYCRDRSLRVKLEVETRTLDDVREVLTLTGVDRIMLDNFPTDRMREAVQLISGAIEVEASGNVTLEAVRRIAETGVDVISVGALTHSPKALDISMKITAQPA